MGVAQIRSPFHYELRAFVHLRQQPATTAQAGIRKGTSNLKPT